MLQETLYCKYQRSPLEQCRDEHCSAVRWNGATATVRTIDWIARQEWPLWPLLGVPLTRRVPRRRETTEITRLGTIRRLVAAIRP